jgi:hypothetical protein
VFCLLVVSLCLWQASFQVPSLACWIPPPQDTHKQTPTAHQYQPTTRACLCNRACTLLMTPPRTSALPPGGVAVPPAVALQALRSGRHEGWPRPETCTSRRTAVTMVWVGALHGHLHVLLIGDGLPGTTLVKMAQSHRYTQPPAATSHQHYTLLIYSMSLGLHWGRSMRPTGNHPCVSHLSRVCEAVYKMNATYCHLSVVPTITHVQCL